MDGLKIKIVTVVEVGDSYSLLLCVLFLRLYACVRALNKIIESKEMLLSKDAFSDIAVCIAYPGQASVKLHRELITLTVNMIYHPDDHHLHKGHA